MSKNVMMCVHVLFKPILALDGRTKWVNNIALRMLCILTRDKMFTISQTQIEKLRARFNDISLGLSCF